MAYPPVIVVDEHDTEVGTAMLADVWRQGLYHRVVTVFVFDDRGRMLLQRRGPHVQFPNRWDQAAGGHVDAGNTRDQTAAIELAEETGLQDTALTPVDTYRQNLREGDCIINRFVRVYTACVPHDAALHPDGQEVRELRWFTAVELKQSTAEQPDAYTPGFLYELRRYFPQFYTS